MKTKSIYIPFLLMILLIFAGCGGSGGSDTSTTAGYGTITMDITDAKPFIEGEEQPEELWIVIEEVQVHKSGEGWISLDLIDTPVEINLLAFTDGLKTKVVPPMPISSGHITQIRLVISSAYMVFSSKPDILIEVPSGKLRTDKVCDWHTKVGGALRITIHFDLSQSIVQTGVDKYKLKPVFHLFDDDLKDAATICGYIDNNSFLDPPEELIATVLYDPTSEPNDEIPYTKVSITKNIDLEVNTTEFCIYWLVPIPTDSDETYVIEISNSEGTYREVLDGSLVKAGYVIHLNDKDHAIVIQPPL